MADCKESNEATKEPEPPVTVQFDSPEESSDNSANDETEKMDYEKDLDNSSSSNSQSNNTSPVEGCSKRKRFKAINFATPTPDLQTKLMSYNHFKAKPPLVRPSQLGAVTFSAKSVLKPAKFQNPFTKVSFGKDDESTSTAESSKDRDKAKETKTEEEEEEPNKEVDNEKEEKNKEKEKETEKEKEKEVPKFLSLSKSSKENENNSVVNTAVTASASTPSFVFGRNLKERVTVAHDADSSDNSEKEESKEEAASENGSSELMFTNAAAVCNKSTSKPGLTLTQAAQELEEANRANKRKYNEVTLLTGEEDETNVLQINCKLFAFDKASSSWQERGRGSLRLNDRDEESRLVGRAAGTQRLVLNTKVWPGMTAERAGPKSLRFTAMDVQGVIRIFLVQAAQKEVEQLHNLLMQRLKRAQERQSKKSESEH